MNQKVKDQEERTEETRLCYLCGKLLCPPTNVDHVPMQQLWTPEIRKLHSPNLVTIKVHKSCNQLYQLDEEYFVASIMPFSKGTYAGESHYRKLAVEVASKLKAPLKIRILREFDFRPSELHLPKGKVAKRFDSIRFNRVLWKIVRGLHFLHFHEVLPHDLTIYHDISIDEPPEHFKIAMSQPDFVEHGSYPGVFAYRFAEFGRPNRVHYWAMLFLDRVIAMVWFHHPNCECGICIASKSNCQRA